MQSRVHVVTVELTDNEAYWLRRVLQTRPKIHVLDRFTIPPDIHDALVTKGLIRWRRQIVEITLEGIREISRHKRLREADVQQPRL